MFKRSLLKETLGYHIGKFVGGAEVIAIVAVFVGMAAAVKTITEKRINVDKKKEEESQENHSL